MPVLTITAKGQVTLRKEILSHLGVRPGQQVLVDKAGKGRIEVKAAPGGSISEAFDMLKPRRKTTLSLDQIGKIAARGWAGRR